jgi:hypothetical protein
VSLFASARSFVSVVSCASESSFFLSPHAAIETASTTTRDDRPIKDFVFIVKKTPRKEFFARRLELMVLPATVPDPSRSGEGRSTVNHWHPLVNGSSTTAAIGARIA